MTHVKNLATIVVTGSLLCERLRVRRGIKSVNIAYTDLKERRGATVVKVCKGGTLNDYVPFYFAPRSPMLFAISKGRVENYPEGQEPVVYLVSTVQTVANAKLPFAFSDGHPVITFTKVFDDLTKLSCVDWNLMNEKYWNDTVSDGDRKRRRQAEFLVHDALPFPLVREVIAMTDATAKRARAALGPSVKVSVQPGCFF